ncbi:MAG: DUF6795 domain-containing protein [Longimicrobiales bacterium]
MKPFSKVVVAGVMVAAAGLLAAGKAMSMGKKCLFSEVQGVVLSNNQPVAGAVVEREFRWTWKGEVGKDQTTTGPKGEFKLPAIYRSSIGSFLPHEPMVRQTILIRHGGQTYKAWMLDKSNYDENGELQGKPIMISCRLETEPKHTGEVYGICDLQ